MYYLTYNRTRFFYDGYDIWVCQNVYQNQSTPSCFIGPPPSQCRHEHKSFTLVSFSVFSVVHCVAERFWAA